MIFKTFLKWGGFACCLTIVISLILGLDLSSTVTISVINTLLIGGYAALEEYYDT